MTTPIYDRVAFIGLGLIASSMALAIREKGLAREITGHAKSAETRATALEIGLCDSVFDTAGAAVEGADQVAQRATRLGFELVGRDHRARLKRCADDAVVDDLDGHLVGGAREGLVGLLVHGQGGRDVQQHQARHRVGVIGREAVRHAGAAVVAGLQGGGGAMISEGRHLYLTTCTKCHAAEPVRDYTASEWAEIIPEMAEESHFTPAQTAAVAAYIEAVLRTSPVLGGSVQ